MKKIRQRHRTGCAVASLAMLLGISYNKALAALHPKRKRYQKVAGEIQAIADTLKSLDKHFVVYCNLGQLFGTQIDAEAEIKALKHPALLCIYTVDLHNANHAVVWDPETQKVLDPGRKRNMPVNYYQKRLLFAFELV